MWRVLLFAVMPFTRGFGPGGLFSRKLCKSTRLTAEPEWKKLFSLSGDRKSETAANVTTAFDWASWLAFVSEAGKGKLDMASAFQTLVDVGGLANATTDFGKRVLMTSVKDLAEQREAVASSSQSRQTGPADLARFEALSKNFEPSSEWLSETARCAELAAAAYANAEAADAFAELGCARVASGVSGDVPWHIVDSARGGVLERHIVVRGFDASDATVDRIALVRRITSAAPAPISPKSPIRIDETLERLGSGMIEQPVARSLRKRCVHVGFLTMAEKLLQDVEPYLFDDSTLGCRLYLTGHSIGGSLVVVLYLLLTLRKIATPKVFTFAALPCCSPGFAALGDDVQGIVQPWDPLVRWYTKNDPCYPLVSDVARDGVTLFASGPPRVLRPLTRAVLQAAADWPSVRDIYMNQANQTYRPIGHQYLLLPEKSRFVSDRNVGWQIDVPRATTVAKLKCDQLHDVLTDIFPLDPFAISLLPAAIRSFVHHFYPAYSLPLVSLAAELSPAHSSIEHNDEDKQGAPSTDFLAAAIYDILNLVSSPVSPKDDDADLAALEQLLPTSAARQARRQRLALENISFLADAAADQTPPSTPDLKQDRVSPSPPSLLSSLPSFLPPPPQSKSASFSSSVPSGDATSGPPTQK